MKLDQKNKASLYIYIYKIRLTHARAHTHTHESRDFLEYSHMSYMISYLF